MIGEQLILFFKYNLLIPLCRALVIGKPLPKELLCSLTGMTSLENSNKR